MANCGVDDGLVRSLFLESSPTGLVRHMDKHHLPLRSAGSGLADSLFPVGGGHEGEGVPLESCDESYVPVLQKVHVQRIFPSRVHKDGTEREVVL